MEIKELNNQQEWDNFVMSLPDYTFVQSWDWGEINKTLEHEVSRWGFFEGERLIGICFAFIIKARRGKILFVPHGPLFTEPSEGHFREALKFLQTKGKEHKCACLRVSPLLEDTLESKGWFKKLHFIDSPSIMHAEDTWLVDLHGNEEEVLMRMRKTTRNLIHRGQREGVVIRQSQDLKDVDYLYQLQMEVVARNHFVPFSKRYLTSEMICFFNDNRAVLFLGRAQGEVTGAALIVFFGKYAYYYQSGSKESKVPVNYVLQWEVILEAKKRGAQLYNMWGIAPNDDSNHPWYGLSLFKKGFGGYSRKYLHAQDLPLSMRYWLTYFIEKIPKTWRQKIKLK